MAFLVDIHLHTRRHSGCSSIDEARLIDQAVRAGLDGIIITDHHYQWPEDELAELIDAANHPGFTVLTGFEYTSAHGDLLVYGLDAETAASFKPRREPEEMLEIFQGLGAVCVAAHPTRAGLGFDARLAQMPFEGIEVASVNLQPHEQRLARRLAADLARPATAASDAHRIGDVGRYATAFDAPIRCMADFCVALRAGAFRPARPETTRSTRV